MNRTDAEQAAWLADKIGALGDYAKEAAEMLRRWPACVTPQDCIDICACVEFDDEYRRCTEALRNVFYPPTAGAAPAPAPQPFEPNYTPGIPSEYAVPSGADGVMANGLTEADTDATASVSGLVGVRIEEKPQNPLDGS